jgi:hypothetical protein
MSSARGPRGRKGEGAPEDGVFFNRAEHALELGTASVALAVPAPDG